MNLTHPSDVRALLDGIGVRPNRTLGQNFLIDRNVLERFVEAAGLSPGDGVLEVGPGLGVVTEALLARAGRVVAVEKDARLAEHLRQRFAACPSLRLIQADMLDLDVTALLGEGLNKVVSNLPYASGTRILVEIIRSPARPEAILVTLQEEVARRLAASPGTADYGQLSVTAQRHYDVAIVRRVSATCFWPAPEIHSAIVRLTRHPRHELAAGLEQRLDRLVRLAFEHRRKQLAGVLAASGEAGLTREAAAALLVSLGLPPDARPEVLSVEAWCQLVRALACH